MRGHQESNQPEQEPPPSLKLRYPQQEEADGDLGEGEGDEDLDPVEEVVFEETFVVVRGEVLDVPAEAVVDLEHDEAHAYRIDHLLRHESSISHSAPLESPLLLPWPRGIGGRAPHLRKTNHCVVPAEIVRDPYPGDQPQTHKDGRGTKDGPVDTDEHGTEIPVTRRGNDLWFVHCSGRTDLTNAATCVRPVRAASVQSSLGRWCRSVAVVSKG